MRLNDVGCPVRPGYPPRVRRRPERHDSMGPSTVNCALVEGKIPRRALHVGSNQVYVIL